METTPRTAVVIAALLALTLAVACGGGGGSPDSTPTALEDTSAPADTATPGLSQSALADLAESMLLALDDFPAGWAEELSDDEDSFDECDRAEPEGRLVRAETGDFTPGGSRIVSQSLAIFESPAQVEGVFLAGATVRNCLVQVVEDGKLDDDEFTYDDASLSLLSFPDYGDQSESFRFRVHVASTTETGLGSEGDLFVDIVDVMVGSVGFTVQAMDVFTPFSTSELEEIVAKAEAKVVAGMASDAGPNAEVEEPTLPAASATPKPEFRVGDQIGAGQLTLTLHSYEAPVPASNQFSAPEPGNIFAVIDVEGCTDENLIEPASLSQFDFRLQLPDNQRIDRSISAKEPELRSTDLLADDCVRGFITFEVPENVTPRYVVYEGRTASFEPIILKWLVSPE